MITTAPRVRAGAAGISLRRLALALLLVGTAGTAGAQTAAPTPTPEAPMAAFGALEQWAKAAVVTLPPSDAAAAPVQVARPSAKGGAVARPFEARPVILGAPDLPLLGEGARQASNLWSPALNFQGLYARLLLVDARTRAITPAPLTVRLKPGQRFRIQLMSTFDALASVDQVVGPAWTAQYNGPVYPAAGGPVALKARTALVLPTEAGGYFSVDGRTPGERLLLRVRHAKAEGAVASDQPIYRQDGADRSVFLQLVPRGTQPVIEQLLVVGK